MTALRNGQAIDYKVVVGKLEVFKEELDELLQDGYELQGGASVCWHPNGVEPCYVQAVVKTRSVTEWRLSAVDL